MVPYVQDMPRARSVALTRWRPIGALASSEASITVCGGMLNALVSELST